MLRDLLVMWLMFGSISLLEPCREGRSGSRQIYWKPLAADA